MDGPHAPFVVTVTTGTPPEADAWLCPNTVVDTARLLEDVEIGAAESSLETGVVGDLEEELVDVTGIDVGPSELEIVTTPASKWLQP